MNRNDFLDVSVALRDFPMNIAVEHELHWMPIAVTDIIDEYSHMTAAEILIELARLDKWKLTYGEQSNVLITIAYSAKHNVFSWATSDIHPELEFASRMNVYSPKEFDDILENHQLDNCFEDWLKDGASDIRWNVKNRLCDVRMAYNDVIGKLLQLACEYWMSMLLRAEQMYGLHPIGRTRVLKS